METVFVREGKGRRERREMGKKKRIKIYYVEEQTPCNCGHYV